MAKLNHHLEYLGAKLVFSLARTMSVKRAEGLVESLARIIAGKGNRRYQIADDNIRQADLHLSESERDKVIMQVFANIGHSFIDLARYEKFGPASFLKFVSGPGASYFQQHAPVDDAAIAVSAHFGNWELCAGYIAASGHPVDALAKVQSNPLINELINKLRYTMGIGLIPTQKGGLRTMYENLNNKRWLYMVADQHDPSGNLILDFFGRPAAFAKGPATLAVKFKKPLLPLLLRRLSHDRYELLSHPPLYPQTDMSDEDNIVAMTKSYVSFFEDSIRKYPEQWMWTHRRWKIEPTGNFS